MRAQFGYGGPCDVLRVRIFKDLLQDLINATYLFIDYGVKAD